MFCFRRLIAVLALLSCLFAGLNGFAEELDVGAQQSAVQQPQKAAGDAVPADAPVQKNTEEAVPSEAVPDNGGAPQDTPAEDKPVPPLDQPAVTPVPTEAGGDAGLSSFVPTVTPGAEDTFEPMLPPLPAGSPEPTQMLDVTPAPTSTMAPTETPESTQTPETTEIPEPTDVPETTEVPGNTEAPAETPEVTVTPEATEVPESTEEPESTEKPEATEEPESTEEPEATETPEETPEPDVEPENTPEPTKRPKKIIKRKKYSSWQGVVPTDEQGIQIPMVFQGDYRDPVCIIDGKVRSVASSGCGATSLSMVIAYLTGNTEQTPYMLFCQAYDAGLYYGNGWSHSTLSRYAGEYGVKSEWIPNNAEMIIDALAQGKPIIAHMGEGIFTSQGHYIVLRGLTEDGKVLVNDPASAKRTGLAYPVEILAEQARRNDCFMVCWVDPPHVSELMTVEMPDVSMPE